MRINCVVCKTGQDHSIGCDCNIFGESGDHFCIHCGAPLN